MFKIRKKKPSLHKVSASSHIKVNESCTQFEDGKELYRQKKYDEALVLFLKCLKDQPENCEYLYYSSIIYLNKHLYKEGLESL